MSISDSKNELARPKSPPDRHATPRLNVVRTKPATNGGRRKKTIAGEDEGQSIVASNFDNEPAAGSNQRRRRGARIPPLPPAHVAATGKNSRNSDPAECLSTEGLKDAWQKTALPLRAIPSWLISSIVHLAAMLALALSTFETSTKPSDLVIIGAVTNEAEPMLVAPVQFEASIQNTSAFFSHVPSADAIGYADVGDVNKVSTQTVGVSVGDLTVSPVGAIGDVYGTRGIGMQSVGLGKQGAEFFGVKAVGRKFMFIVDSSNSMRGGKFDDAKRELLYAIQRLTKGQYFYVIFFDNGAERMRLFPNETPEENAVEATIENIKRVEKWVQSVDNERRTDPYDAVKFGLEMLPDAIYLLSDGQFTDKGQTVRYLKNNNIVDDPIEGRRPKVVLHTVGFYSRDGEENLLSIAKAYGGSYRFVPPPDKKR